MSNIVDIAAYTPCSKDDFFFDCNVWLFNFCPIGSYSKKQQEIYSKFLNEARQNRATIWVNSLVLSEFANRYLRLDFNLWVKSVESPSNAEYKKDYIGSKRYKLIVTHVENAIRNILKLSEKTSDDFHRIGDNMDDVFLNFQQIDFNDSYYYEFCRRNNYTLVSDDQDFKKVPNNNVKVVTLVR